MKKVRVFFLPLSILVLLLFFSENVRAQCEVSINKYMYLCNTDSVTLDANPIGIPPFTYLWSTGQTTEMIHSIVPATGNFIQYFLTVTDATGCVAFGLAHVKYTAFHVPLITVNIDEPCEGEIVNLNAIVDVPGVTFLWSTGSTFMTIQTGDPGIYSVTATDPVSGCTFEMSQTISFLPRPQPVIQGPATLCSGQSTTLSLNGGPFCCALWSTGAFAQTIQITEPGTYAVQVAAVMNGCVGADTITILPAGVAPILNGPPSLCAGQSGTIDITNASSYTNYQWSTGESSSTISINGPGNYSVTVTESGGCTAIGNITVNSGSSNITLSGIESPVTSCASQNGSIDLMITPTGPYTYSWSNGASTQDLFNLSIGTYTVTVFDAGGCTSVSSYIVTSNLILPNPVTNFTAASCGLNNGTVNLSVSPAGSYSYIWSGGQTTQNLANLFAGTYSVTVTSATNGCTATANVIVPNINSIINISGTTTPLNSCTSANGAIDITIIPAGTYTFAWSNGDTTEDLTNVFFGTYTVTVSSSAGCTAMATYIVANNTIPPTLITTPTPATCGQSNGAIDLNVTPAGTYINEWSNGSTTEDLFSIQGGNYSVTVTSSDGCSNSINIIVPDSSIPLEITGTPSPNTMCIGQNGAIDITVNPPGTYSYLWSNGATTEDLNNMMQGVYNVTVTFGLTCINTQSFEILNNVAPITLTGNTTPNTSCSQSNGAIDLTIISPGSFTYVWSNGETTEDLQSLTGGTYSITVTGSDGCISTASFDIINSNSNFSFTENLQPNTSCILPNGSIDLTLTPVGTYSFVWSTGASTEDLQNIAGGLYVVTITNILNCSVSDTFMVANNTSIPTVLANITPANCGTNNGSIDLTINPNINTTFLWSTAGTTEDLQNIFPGSYIVTVTDTTNGCLTVDTFTIQNINNNFSISGISSPNTSCTILNGSIDLNITPAGSYFFAWSNGNTSEDLNALNAGSYSVTVTDNLSCSSTAIFIVDDNLSASTITNNITPSTCGNNNGAVDLTIIPSMGNTFLWSNGATTEDLQNVLSGIYSLTITGSNGCIASDTVFVPDIGSTISLSAFLTANTNCILPNGAIDLSIIPVGAYTYAWSNGIITADQTNLLPGIYTVTVSDANGCSSSATYIIDNLTIKPVITQIISPSSCGNANGQIDLTINPIGTYLINWSNGITTEDLINITSGLYDVTVTNQNGCTSSALFIVPNTNSNFSISVVTVDNTSCTAGNGSIDITITPAGSYSISWSNGATSEDLNNLLPGSYSVTVTDASNCSSTDIYIVDDSIGSPTVVETIIPVMCGEANGSIDLTVTPSGGNNFIWSDGSVTEDLENILPGSYTVTITASNGCSWSSGFSVPGTEKINIELETDVIQAGDDFVTIRAQINVPLTELDTLIWLPENLFNCDQVFCLEQTIKRPTQKTEVMVIAIDKNGCMAQASLLLDAEINPQVYIPNVFTPNSDGVNDFFTVYGNKEVEQVVELRIFDRWGNYVFNKREFQPNIESLGWDGKFKNSALNPDVFAYWTQVKYTDGTLGFYKGDVTIVR